MEVNEKQTELLPIEWKLLADALKGTRYESAVLELKNRNNEPTCANEIFCSEVNNQGDEHVNNRLRRMKIPLRLSRVDSWSRNEKRRERKLAFRRWGTKQSK